MLISSLDGHRRVTVAGRVHTVEIRQAEHSSILACAIADGSGEITALFYDRSHIPGLEPGSNVRLRGTVSADNAETVLINPAYGDPVQPREPARQHGQQPHGGSEHHQGRWFHIGHPGAPAGWVDGVPDQASRGATSALAVAAATG